VPAERAGQGEVDGCTKRMQTACLPLDLVLASPCSALDRPFLSSFAQMGSEIKTKRIHQVYIPHGGNTV